MDKRKTICCISIRPAEVYQQKVISGLQAQCNLYGYNLAVFSPLVDITHYYKDYLHGELNLFKLPDFDSFDAIVIVCIPLVEYGDTTKLANLYETIRKSTDKPVIALDHHLDGAYESYTDDITAFSRITEHIITEHGCKKIYFLSGQEGFDVSVRRTKGYTAALEKHGLPINNDYIFNGDFWYTSGEALAEKIISGEVEMPEAVVCAGDHPAIGLVNALTRGGIKVPEQIIVTGYEATLEAVTNSVGITSYIAEIKEMAAKAVNRIRELIEPGMPVSPTEKTDSSGVFIGESCGCKVDSARRKKYIQNSLYRTNRNYNDKEVLNNSDISNIIESYMLENLTKCESPLECLKDIYINTYLIQPYDHFYLCLRPDWLDTESPCTTGYPDTMRCVIHSAPEESKCHADNLIHCRNDNRDNFDTRLMLPQLWHYNEKPSIFYFSPTHFSDNTFGYSVLQCDLDKNIAITHVFHIWMRNVNNALEMIRARNKLISNSIVDSMTKLCNRRGMKIRINDLLSIAEPDDCLMAMVIDMDGLKRINDTYGHNEGDYALMTIASVVRCITEGNEVSARAGGDEFYILGVGKYTKEIIENKIERFYSVLVEQNKIAMKPFEIAASVGFAIKPVAENEDVSEIIADADSSMYTSKIQRKKQRNG